MVFGKTVPLDDDEESYNEAFEAMPWQAIKYDTELIETVRGRYEIPKDAKGAGGFVLR